MNLDFATMTFVAGVAALLAAVCVLALWLGHRNEPALKWFPLASLAGAAGLFVFWSVPTPRPLVPRILGNAGLILAHVFILVGIATLYEKTLRAWAWHIGTVGAAVLLFAVNWALGDWFGVRVWIYTLCTAVPVAAAIAVLSGRFVKAEAFERSPLARRMVMAILLAHLAFHLYRAGAISLDRARLFGEVYHASLINTLGMLDGVLLSLGLAWGMAAMHGQKLARSLERIAHRDPLTSLSNRLAVREAFGRVLTDAEKRDGAFCLAVADLDGFKQVNDTAGHAAGDRVLEHVAETVAENLRPTDVVGRVGGDEFLMLLPEADRDGGLIAMERVLDRVPRDPPAEAPQAVSLSVGLAAYPHDGDSFDQLYRAADRALYEAKANGKGQVVSRGELAPDDR